MKVFTKQTIDRLTNNKIERLKVSLIELLLDNRIHENNN